MRKLKEVTVLTNEQLVKVLGGLTATPVKTGVIIIQDDAHGICAS